MLGRGDKCFMDLLRENHDEILFAAPVWLSLILVGKLFDAMSNDDMLSQSLEVMAE